MDAEAPGTVTKPGSEIQESSKDSKETDDDSQFSQRGGIPRKPSIMKDNSRKNSRKKTVSFSSFPEDKPISKGN